jgi:hypothetical protein
VGSFTGVTTQTIAGKSSSKKNNKKNILDINRLEPQLELLQYAPFSSKKE